MKPAPFEYSRATSVEEACALLARDDDARFIAGGQTLAAMMAMRLARPTRLVDISRLAELSFIREDGPTLVIGATTRQALAERHALVAQRAPLLARALPHVGHAATRNRGTIGGSLANADPAAEIALALTTLQGFVVARDARGERQIATRDFFTGPMMTSLGHDELLTEARFPTWSYTHVGAAFLEVSHRQGDFALASAAAQVALDDDGRCLACAIGTGGGAPVPTRLDAASTALVGARIDDDARDPITEEVEAIDFMTDPSVTPEWRRRACATLAWRALIAAREDALATRMRS